MADSLTFAERPPTLLQPYLSHHWIPLFQLPRSSARTSLTYFLRSRSRSRIPLIYLLRSSRPMPLLRPFLLLVFLFPDPGLWSLESHLQFHPQLPRGVGSDLLLLPPCKFSPFNLIDYLLTSKGLWESRRFLGRCAGSYEPHFDLFTIGRLTPFLLIVYRALNMVYLPVGVGRQYPSWGS
jgi:hypothetical protein